MRWTDSLKEAIALNAQNGSTTVNERAFWESVIHRLTINQKQLDPAGNNKQAPCGVNSHVYIFHSGMTNLQITKWEHVEAVSTNHNNI